MASSTEHERKSAAEGAGVPEAAVVVGVAAAAGTTMVA